ncbi:MAG: hypothetical protein GF329_13915 [Candidatus Lokiarchaeota archaeon]|nr:hypothetical protein [Candidatus Lokiarchaeota archaeon]
MVCSPNCVSLTTTPNASPAVPAVVFMCMDLRAWLSPINHTSIIYENKFINLSNLLYLIIIKINIRFIHPLKEVAFSVDYR